MHSWNRFGTASVMALGMVLVPVCSAQQKAHSASAHGVANRGYLGVGVVELTEGHVKALHLKDDQGVEVARIDENSPAARAGLQSHDVIVEVNGKAIDDIAHFQLAIGELAPGTKISLTVWRNGVKQSIVAKLDSRPDSLTPFGTPDAPDAPMPPMPPVPFNGGSYPFPGMPNDSPLVGFVGEPIDGQLAEYFGVKEGVLVRSVTAKTAAERAGLKAGDVVTRVNGTPVMSPREITGLVRTAGKKAISFTVVRNKKEVTLNVEIAEDRSGASDRVPL